VLSREQRLTFLDQLPADNEVVAGELWSDPGAAEVSVEQGYADDLGVGLGSRLTFDVQGVPIELVVTSLRNVVWQSFAINFFLVVEPGVLEEAPHFRLAAARLPEAEESALEARIARGFPNITVLGVRSVLEKVLELLARSALGVRLLGGLACVAGLFVLAGSASAARLERGRDAALLKTLGVTRAGVAALFATEYALCGAVAGALGAACGALLARGFLVHVLELPFRAPLGTLALAAATTGLFSALFGLAASARALGTRPLATLARAG
jgi:putative ABC transport system permease protein